MSDDTKPRILTVEDVRRIQEHGTPFEDERRAIFRMALAMAVIGTEPEWEIVPNGSGSWWQILGYKGGEKGSGSTLVEAIESAERAHERRREGA